MKNLIIPLLLTFCSCFSQEHNESEQKPHLDKKNEIRVGNENTSLQIEFERQIDDHLSLGIKTKINNNQEEELYYDDIDNEKLYIGVNGKYYFKHFITHSFLYLFFDDSIKIRYYAEGNMGYSKSQYKFTSRFTDDENNFVIARKNTTENNFVGTLGLGAKFLINKRFTFDFSFGGGNYFINKNNRDYTYSYARYGFGYRF